MRCRNNLSDFWQSPGQRHLRGLKLFDIGVPNKIKMDSENKNDFHAKAQRRKEKFEGKLFISRETE